MSTFARTNYKLTDSIEAYGQLLYTHYKTYEDTVGVNVGESTTTVSASNPSIPADLRTILASRPNPTAPFQYNYNTARISSLRFTQENDIYQALGGVRGKIGLGDFSYDAYVSHGQTTQTQTSIGYVDRQAFQNVTGAADGGNGICPGGYSLFDLAPVSDACKAYLGRTTSGQDRFKQTEAELNIEGGLIHLPAGEVRLATGGDWRRNSFTSRPDAQFVNNQLQGSVVVAPGSGSQSVYEFFAELFVPVLSDLPLIHKLSLDGAYRYSHYNTSGGVNTYKVSGEWSVVQPVTFRGGYQRAIRAPSVGELFSGVRQGSSSIGTPQQGGGDPCDIRSAYRRGADGAQVRALCLAQGIVPAIIDTFQTNGTTVATEQTAKPGLTPEIADTFTAGAVVTSPFGGILSGFSASVDWYKIKIRDAIGTIPASVSLQTCFNGTGQNPSYDIANPFCQNINRISGGIHNVIEASANLARYVSSGIDGEVDWTIKAESVGLKPGLGSFATNVVVSYVPQYKIQTNSTAALLNFAGTIGNNTIDVESLSHPKWRVTASGTYNVGALSLGVRYRYIDKMANSVGVGSSVVANGVKSIGYFDINGRVQISDQFQFRFGVINVGDKQPPVWTGQAATDPSTYDLIGRRFFAGVTAKF